MMTIPTHVTIWQVRNRCQWEPQPPETTTQKHQSPTGWCYFTLPESHGNGIDVSTVFVTKIPAVASQPGSRRWV